MTVDDPLHSRFLVIGSGIAGLQFALLAAPHGTVRIATKKESNESNTNYAQGGIAAVLSPLDDFASHVRDTLTAGDGLCREPVVRAMVEAAPRLIARLLDVGCDFSRQGAGTDAPFALGREGGHSHSRIVHAKDLTGREIEARLLAACRREAGIRLEENHLGLDLIHGRALGLAGADAQRIVGCWILDHQTLSRRACLADVVVLATGGCGKVYSYTSNPDIATGDGLAMACRAGATLANLEFVQFHPTCLYHPDAKSFLISEAVRGEGAVLINARGERFMERYHPLRDLAPRDVVARSIDQEMKATGAKCVFLDLRHLERAKVEARFPNLVATCARFGIDMAGEPVPVVPAAHYMCGGVRTDLQGRTNLPGLYAIGEVACTGVHGANRLASNSLLEAVFFAETAAAAAAQESRRFAPEEAPPAPRDDRPPAHDHGPEHVVLDHDWDTVRRVMWDYVGIVRNRQRLDIALSRVRDIRRTVEEVYRSSCISPDLVELRNIALVAEMIVLCARARRESRGLHWTVDHPGKAPGPARDTLIGRGRRLRALALDPADDT
ncbi:MAG: L-aspartate oxidase [Candidatus Krumholzibacteriia bacterium]